MSKQKPGVFLVVKNPKPRENVGVSVAAVIIAVPPNVSPKNRKLRKFTAQFRGKKSRMLTLTSTPNGHGNGHRTKSKRAPPH
jgi:GTPase involved in cell partitioning and DNA repair